jgi:hypothetical protein
MLADASRHLDDYLAPYQLSGDRGPLAATSSDVSIRPGTDHSDHQAQHVLVPSDCDHPVYHQNAECWSAEPAALWLLRRDQAIQFAIFAVIIVLILRDSQFRPTRTCNTSTVA